MLFQTLSDTSKIVRVCLESNVPEPHSVFTHKDLVFALGRLWGYTIDRLRQGRGKGRFFDFSINKVLPANDLLQWR